MPLGSVIVFTTGEPGAGKSYVRGVRFLLDDFLLNSDGVWYSNIPVVKDEIVKEACRRLNFAKTGPLSVLAKPFRRKHRLITEDDVAQRIQLIPSEVIDSWRSGASGPWEYFDGCDLRYAHIAIDEIHECIPFNASADRVQPWETFLGTIRHRGCTFECITQSPERVHECVVGRAGVQVQLCPAESERDPFFGIVMSDWYNLKASFVGEYHKTVFERHLKNVFGRWRATITKRFLITPEYFKFWHSYNAAQGESDNGVKAEDRAPKEEYQLRSRLSLFAWFVRRNFFSLFSRLSILFLFVWLCFGGGMVWFMGLFLGSMHSVAAANTVHRSSQPSQAGQGGAKPSPSSSAPSPSASVDSGAAHEYQLIIERKDKELSSVREELEALKAERKRRYEPVFFEKDSVLLQNGMRIHKNYLFDKESIYAGRKVVEINLVDRSYMLDDDTVVRMWSR